MHVGDLDTILLTGNGVVPVLAQEGKIENYKKKVLGRRCPQPER
jgi:hypothetical protein